MRIKRRHVLGGTVLALIVAQAAWAGFISYPKTWGFKEELKSTDLNQNFAAISAVVNGGIDDSNVNGAAGIKGTKIADAPNGIPPGKINAGAVDPTALQMGATIHASGTGMQVARSTFSTAETSLVTTSSLATRGGPTLIVGSLALILGHTSGAFPGEVLTIRLYRDSTKILEKNYTDVPTAGIIGAAQPFDASVVFLETPSAGTHAYHVTAFTTSANFTITTLVDSGQLAAIELS